MLQIIASRIPLKTELDADLSIESSKDYKLTQIEKPARGDGILPGL